MKKVAQLVFLLAWLTLGAAAPSPVVHFDIAADPGNLNPLFAHPDAASVEAQLARLVFEPFIDVDEHGRLVPALLSQIPTLQNGGLARDGRTIIYKLRRNVTWSDGVPVTAADVLYTLQAIANPHNPVRSREGYDRIASAYAYDTYTVVVRMKRPWAPATVSFFTAGASSQFVLPAHLLIHQNSLEQSPFNDHPVGDGPFLFVSWHRGERLEYVSNPRYWRGEPATKRLDVGIVPDPGTNLTLLQTRSIDWNLIAPDQQAIVERQPNIAFQYVPLALIAGVIINTTHPPFNDVRVRRALAASIDRQAMSRKITLGRYAVIDTAQPLYSWYRDPSVHEPAYDPIAADRMLDASGWLRGSDGMREKDGKKLALVYVQFPETRTGVAAATFIQAELRIRGIDVTIKSISNAQLFLPQTGILATGNFDLAYVPFPVGVDPDDSYLFRCGGVANYARWCDPHVDGLEQEALINVSATRRKAIYSQIEHAVADAVPIIYLFDPSYVYAYDKRLTGFAPQRILADMECRRLATDEVTQMTQAPPLTGIRVLEVGNYMAGPFCGMQLADLGADVVKIENPDGGDMSRQGGPFVEGEGANFLRINRNKRSLALDLKTPEGKDIFRKLVTRADIVVENLRPGTMRGLELDYERLHAINPRLIYVAASGWGQDGPYGSLPGLDIMAQAMSGLMSITGEEGGGPVKIGVPMCDLVCALYGALAAVAALRVRETTGEGQLIDVSLFEAGVSFSIYEAAKYFTTGEIPRRHGSAHQTNAVYQALRSSDGYFTVGANSEKNWIAFCKVLGLEQLANDPRYTGPAKRREKLAELLPPIEAVTTTKPARFWVDALQKAGVPCSLLQNYDQVFNDPHLLARNYFVDAPHAKVGDVRQLGSPMRFSDTPVQIKRAGPLLGEDTADVLGELGLGEAEITQLNERGVVGLACVLS